MLCQYVNTQYVLVTAEPLKQIIQIFSIQRLVHQSEKLRGFCGIIAKRHKRCVTFRVCVQRLVMFYWLKFSSIFSCSTKDVSDVIFYDSLSILMQCLLSLSLDQQPYHLQVLYDVLQ